MIKTLNIKPCNILITIDFFYFLKFFYSTLVLFSFIIRILLLNNRQEKHFHSTHLCYYLYKNIGTKEIVIIKN